MHGVLVNRLGGLSLPRKSVVRLTDRPDMTLDVYRGRKTTIQQYNMLFSSSNITTLVRWTVPVKAYIVSLFIVIFMQKQFKNPGDSLR